MSMRLPLGDVCQKYYGLRVVGAAVQGKGNGKLPSGSCCLMPIPIPNAERMGENLLTTHMRPSCSRAEGSVSESLLDPTPLNAIRA